MRPPMALPFKRYWVMLSTFENWLAERRIKAVIPSTASRRTPYPIDRNAYRRRNVIERVASQRAMPAAQGGRASHHQPRVHARPVRADASAVRGSCGIFEPSLSVTCGVSSCRGVADEQAIHPPRDQASRPVPLSASRVVSGARRARPVVHRGAAIKPAKSTNGRMSSHHPPSPWARFGCPRPPRTACACQPRKPRP
jgi:hypothetical protein